jgi:hypothetical protein
LKTCAWHSLPRTILVSICATRSFVQNVISVLMKKWKLSPLRLSIPRLVHGIFPHW